MLQTHTIDPEDPASGAGQALYTITAGGFSATADAFARDEQTEGLWFVSMVGSQTALKAIWASLLKQPPDVAHIIKGADGMALHGGYQRCIIPYETIGTWTTKIARLPATGGWHALVYTKTAEFGYEKDSFLWLLAQSEEDAPALHHRFLDKRSPLAPPRHLGRMALGAGPGGLSRLKGATPTRAAICRRSRVPSSGNARMVREICSPTPGTVRKRSSFSRHTEL